ncbi:MAG: hypothetical protein ACRBCI_07160 [Cellvibrionaceae bacterium]
MNNLTIRGSVGKAGHNLANDVKLVRALLNAYLRSRQKPTLPITDKTDATLEQAISDYQSTLLKSANPDSRVDARGKTFTSLKAILKRLFQPVSYKPPTFGLLTWESEGTEGGFYHSRKLHIPSSYSGLTIGRGYDCSQKTQSKISSDLIKAGISTSKAAILKQAAGLRGARAKRFVINNDLLDYQISHTMQYELFKISYNDELNVVKRISGKSTTVRQYGSVDWSKLNTYIKDVVVDLKYRGDYTPTSRKFLQTLVVNNNIAKFKKAIQDKKNWPNVPQGRFKKRSDFIAKAKTPSTTIKKPQVTTSTP